MIPAHTLTTGYSCTSTELLVIIIILVLDRSYRHPLKQFPQGNVSIT